MSKKRSRLQALRNRAEIVLSSVDSAPIINSLDVNELIHELKVYHTELELQLEDLQESYNQLEASQNQYATLFNNAPVGYIVIDSDAKILKSNLVASTMLGIQQSELKSQSLTNFITSDYQDSFHLHRRSALQTQQVQICEVQLNRSDGTIFYAQLRTHMSNSEIMVLHIAMIDLSAIKQTQDALELALSQEKQINQLRNRVIAVISHEFRTPLAAILSSVELLERYDERLTPEKKKQRYLTIRNMVWYLNDIVQDISVAQDLNNHVDRLKLQTFDVLTFIRQLIADIFDSTNMSQKIVLTTNENDNCEGRLDEHLLSRILINLISNALRYSDTDVICHLIFSDDFIRFTIEDHGIGISQEDQTHMYEVFYRGTTAQFTSGTGIGLFVVAQSIELHRGHIDCESVIGEGTKFTVELPRYLTIEAE